MIPCKFVEVHDNLGTIVGAGIDTFWVPELPATVQLLLAVRLLALQEEISPGVAHTVSNRIRDPEGNVIGEATGSLEVAGESARPDWLIGIILPAGVRFEAATEGTYTVELGVDAASHSLPIHVAHGTPGSPA